MKIRIWGAAVGLMLVATAGVLLAVWPSTADETTVAKLSATTHFHGLSVDAADPSRLFLATHHGLYLVAQDGTARLVSARADDLMGFTPHPADPTVLYASGHPAGGGNLGFVTSKDGGRTWTKLADGIGGPVDFHAMDVSKADPRVIYGVFGDLQRSSDGGTTWERIARAPEGLFAIAASGTDAVRLYAATQSGLLVSRDGGRRWQDAYGARRPATMVSTASTGLVLAFIPGMGLLRASEADLAWHAVSNSFGERAVLHLAVDPQDARALYVVTVGPRGQGQAIEVSRDGGATWSRLGGN